MHIGCCEKCRYLDLIENVDSECPRCGAKMVSLNVGTRAWNRMSASDKEEMINRVVPRIPVSEVFMQLVNGTTTEPETAEAPVKAPVPDPEPIFRVSADVTAEPEPEPAWNEEPELEEPKPEMPKQQAAEDTPKTGDAKPVTKESEQTGEAVAEPVVEAAPVPIAKMFTKPVHAADVRFDMVYVCYKCNSVAAHDGVEDRYYCSECGSDMVDIGLTTREWADLSKEEKRRMAEEAKIRHMVTAIKNSSFDEGENVSTPNIINVVQNKDSIYV